VIVYRALLATATAACGIVILARMAPYGLRLETLPGLVLGGAMIGLGVHRLRLIARLRGNAR